MSQGLLQALSYPAANGSTDPNIAREAVAAKIVRVKTRFLGSVVSSPPIILSSIHCRILVFSSDSSSLSGGGRCKAVALIATFIFLMRNRTAGESMMYWRESRNTAPMKNDDTVLLLNMVD